MLAVGTKHNNVLCVYRAFFSFCWVKTCECKHEIRLEPVLVFNTWIIHNQPGTMFPHLIQAKFHQIALAQSTLAFSTDINHHM